MSHSLTELPLEILSPLHDLTVTEKQPITLECKVSKPDKKAIWKKDGKELRLKDGMTFISDNGVHRMVIDSAEKSDKGDYSVEIDDVWSSATLTVEGTAL